MHDGGPSFFGLEAPLSEARLVGFSAEGWPLIETADGARAEARSLVALSGADQGRAVAFAMIGGATEGTALILGLIQGPAQTVMVDGEAVRIEAKRELRLRCGPASIALFADGRVEIRGTQILSRSERSNRMQGASVQLN